MRPQVMLDRFDEALELISGDGIDRVAAMRPTYRGWCERLAASPVPASIDHNDLHAWNILAGERFYDWGDAVVAHPFASMLGGLGFSPISEDEVPRRPRRLPRGLRRPRRRTPSWWRSSRLACRVAQGRARLHLAPRCRRHRTASMPMPHSRR